MSLMGPIPPVPNAPPTAAMIQAATITHSKEWVNSSNACVKKGGTLGHPNAPLGQGPQPISGDVDLSEDGRDRTAQLCRDVASGVDTERKNHCRHDTSRDEHVLERNHALRVRTQVLQGLGGLNIILQHGRNSFFTR